MSDNVSVISTDEVNQRKSWKPLLNLYPEHCDVEEFDYDLLPSVLIPWVRDTAERTQCPVDYLVVTLMVALSHKIAGKVSICPKQYDDWQVVVNLWGMIIGRPSTMKTPAMSEMLRPLNELANRSRLKHEQCIAEYEVDRDINDYKKSSLDKKMKKAISSENNIEVQKIREALLVGKEQFNKRPTEQRSIVNDCTVEKIGELLNENPYGLLIVRDELAGFINTLDKEDKIADRAFYLECFNGNGSYTYDRIGRGTIYIRRTIVSIVGGIQPAKIQRLVSNAVNENSFDDGLIQRLQLSVYPKESNTYKHVDRSPDKDAYDEAFNIFKKLEELDIDDSEERISSVRFDVAGQLIFNTWLIELENKIRSKDIHPAMEAHLAKYKSLMPSLALIINVIDEGHENSVTKKSTKRAVKWCAYLESHARRIYGPSINISAQNADNILKNQTSLPDGFSCRDVYRKGWAGLKRREKVVDAINKLIECGYLCEVISQPRHEGEGGRPKSCTYYWNPEIS